MGMFEKYHGEDASVAEATSAASSREEQILAAVGMINEDEMSSMLRVTIETLATWRTRKQGPPWVKIGKKVFYLIADFSRWVMEEAERQKQALPRKRRRNVGTSVAHAASARAGVQASEARIKSTPLTASVGVPAVGG